MTLQLIELRPPRIAMLLLAAAAALHWLTPLGRQPVVPSAWLAVVTGTAGFAIMIRAWWQFRRDSVAICPTAETDRLITDGIYRVTRNPMYLGIVLMLAGVASWFGTLPFVTAAAAWWAIIQFVFCPYEERKLESTFGAVYRDYRNRVRRWL
jgi:protein-S-isoprenylcysteine O-methyltransferase Ste14